MTCRSAWMKQRVPRVWPFFFLGWSLSCGALTAVVQLPLTGRWLVADGVHCFCCLWEHGILETPVWELTSFARGADTIPYHPRSQQYAVRETAASNAESCDQKASTSLGCNPISLAVCYTPLQFVVDRQLLVFFSSTGASSCVATFLF